MLLHLCVSEIFFNTFLKLKAIVSVGLIIFFWRDLVYLGWNGNTLISK